MTSSTSYKDWLLRHQELEFQRGLRERRDREARRRGEKPARTGWAPSKFTLVMSPPELDFGDHYEPTTAFLDRIRATGKTRKRPMFISMRRCVSMTPEVALVLASELERWLSHWPRSINGNNPNSREVTAMLRSIGFFRTLNFNEPKGTVRAAPTTYMQIKAGTQGGGYFADDLQKLVLGDVVKPTELLTDKLIAGLNEAVLNVHQHAYPDDIQHDLEAMPNKRWWIAGYRDSSDRTIGFMAYDQGVGIPATLPKARKDLVDDVIQKTAHLFAGGSGNIDHLLIQRATEVGRTRTGLVSQGFGLNDFKKLIEAAGGKGTLRILSGRGSYLYKEDQQEVPTPLGSRFHGTLIIWRLTASPAVVWEE